MGRVLTLALLLALVPAFAVAQSVDPKSWDNEDSATEKSGEKAEKSEGEPEAEWKVLKTGYKMVKKFNYTLPPSNPQTAGMSGYTQGAKDVVTRLPLPSPALSVTRDGRKLGIDVNGDQKPDEWCKGAMATIQVLLQYPDGTKAPYAVEIVRNGKKFQMSRSCYRYASFGGQRITLIDNDSDGYYDNFGVDAMIVGRGSYAQYLSDKIAIRGKVYEFQVNRPGTEIKVREWSGEMGKVALHKGFKANGKLAAALLISGNSCFDASKPTAIPAGSYTLKWGVVAASGRSCKFKGSQTVIVKADGEVHSLDFGGPFKMTFSVNKTGTKFTVPAYQVGVTDKAGFTYYDFNRRLLPYIQVRDANTKKVVDKGKMATG